MNRQQHFSVYLAKERMITVRLMRKGKNALKNISSSNHLVHEEIVHRKAINREATVPTREDVREKHAAAVSCCR